MDISDENGLQYKYDALCKTGIKKSETYRFVWRIYDFSLRTEKNGEFLSSEQFTVKGPDNKMTKWCVQLYPRGKVEDSTDDISLFLKKLTIDEEVDAFYVLSLLDANKAKHKLHQLNVTKFSVRKTASWGWNKVMDRNHLSQYTPDDILTLIVEITIIGKTKKSIEFVKSGEGCSTLTEYYHHTQLVQDVEALFLSKDHSDVLIRCGDKVYDCHKNILGSRSPVFKSMFKLNMKEKMTGDVEIKDMDHEVLEDLLKYIYSGGAPNIDEHVQELFYAADQYQIDKLKELCEVKLCSRLDTSNCIDLLILSDLHNAQILKVAALEFLFKNMQKMNTSEWTRSLIAHPALIAEVMVKVLPMNVDEHTITDEVKQRGAS